MRFSSLRLGAAVALVALAAGCGDETPEARPPALAQHIGPEGGLIEHQGFAISLPEGALAETIEIKIWVSDEGADEVVDRVRTSRVWKVEPENIELLSPATVVVPWYRERLPAGIPASASDVRRKDTLRRAQERLNAIRVDEAALTVAGETRAFGVFWATAPSAPRPATISVTPASLLLFAGQTSRFNAEVRDQNGRVMTGQPVAWSSSNAQVATIDQDGEVSALAPGVVQILAKAGAAQGKALLQVAGNEPYARRFEWENPVPQANPLLAVGGNDQVLAVAGESGTLLVLDSQGWKRLPAGAGAALNRVVFGGGRLGAAGARGTDGVVVLHDDALTEQVVPDTPVTGLWLGPGRAVAVGDGPNLAILEGGVWSIVPSPVTEPLLAVDASGGDPVVFGARGAVYKRVGQGWTALSTNPLPQFQMQAIARGEEAFAISANALRRFAEGTWSSVKLPDEPELLLDALGWAGVEPVIAGHEPVGGQAWLLVPADDGFAPLLVGAYQVRGVWGRSRTDLYVVTDEGAILHYDGESWQDIREGALTPIVGLAAFDGPRVFAATNVCADEECAQRKGQVLSRDPETGRFEPLGGLLGSDVTALAGRGADDLLAAGSTGVGHRWNGSAWKPMPAIPGMPINALAACSTGYYAAGTGRVYREEQGEWKLIASTGYSRYRGLACAGQGLFAVGDYSILRIGADGGATVLSPAADGLATTIWRAVWADAEGHALIGGDARFLLWWNGSRFEAWDRPGNLSIMNVRALWGTSYGNIWMAGTLLGGGSFLAHFNGATWTKVETGTELPLNAMSGLSNGELWVGGDRGAILHGVVEP